MQLYKTDKEDKFNVMFDEYETDNIKKIVGDIDIGNPRLCYFIEQALFLMCSEFSTKRAMILDISNGYNYISAVVKAQDIDICFKKPTQILRVTEILFKDVDAYLNWKKENKRIYKLEEENKRGVLVLVPNLSLDEEIGLALNCNVVINYSLNILSFFLHRTLKVIKECFEN